MLCYAVLPVQSLICLLLYVSCGLDFMTAFWGVSWDLFSCLCLESENVLTPLVTSPTPWVLPHIFLLHSVFLLCSTVKNVVPSLRMCAQLYSQSLQAQKSCKITPLTTSNQLGEFSNSCPLEVYYQNIVFKSSRGGYSINKMPAGMATFQIGVPGFVSQFHSWYYSCIVMLLI